MDKKETNILLDVSLDKADNIENEIYDLLSVMIGASRNKESAIQISATIIDKINELDNIILSLIDKLHRENMEKPEYHGYLEKGKEALEKFNFGKEKKLNVEDKDYPKHFDIEPGETVEMDGDELLDLIEDILGDEECLEDACDDCEGCDRENCDLYKTDCEGCEQELEGTSMSMIDMIAEVANKKPAQNTEGDSNLKSLVNDLLKKQEK